MIVRRLMSTANVVGVRRVVRYTYPGSTMRHGRIVDLNLTGAESAGGTDAKAAILQALQRDGVDLEK